MKPLVLVFLSISFIGASFGQDKRAQDAARRLQQQNQRLASEKAQLERERGQLAQKLAEQEKEAKKQADGARARHGRELAKLREESAQKLAEAAAREEELKAKLAATEQSLAESRREGELLRKRIANQQETIGFWQAKSGACAARNDELSRIGYELVERYRVKTCGDVGVDNDVFTGIGRARMENLLEDYKDRLRGQRAEGQK